MSTSTEGLPVPQWDLGDRLAKALKVADLSAQDIADYLEVHRNTVSSWMNNRGKPPGRPILIAWALRTGVPFEWLKDGLVGATNGNGPDDPGCPHQGSNLGPADYQSVIVPLSVRKKAAA